MRYNRFEQSLQALAGLHSRLEQAHYADTARRKAEELDRYMATAKPSGLLGDGRLAIIDDVVAANLLDPAGIFLGAMNGRMLFYNGDEPLLTYQRTRSGKGRDLILPNLAHLRNRTVFVTDPKEGENAWCSAAHRQSTGSKCVFLNPFGLHGFPNTKINPLQWPLDVIDAGGIIETEAVEIAEIILPKPARPGENEWVRSGAVRMVALIIEFLALFDRDNCTLGNVWAKVNCGDDELDVMFKIMSTCGIEGIERRAKALQSTFDNAPKQFEAVRTGVQDAVAVFEKGKTLDRSTNGHEIDLRRVKHEPHTIYLMVPSDKLSAAAPWMSLILSYAIETIAKERGPITSTFILDEFAQLPASASFLKALRLYAGKGIQPWFQSQGRFSLDKWSPEAVKEMEDQAGVMTLRYVSDPSLMRDLELWSGNQTILSRGRNHGGGLVESASASLGETKRPLLQSEDILGMGDKMILKLARSPHLYSVDALPFFQVTPWRDQIRDVRKLHRGEI